MAEAFVSGCVGVQVNGHRGQGLLVAGYYDEEYLAGDVCGKGWAQGRLGLGY